MAKQKKAIHKTAAHKEEQVKHHMVFGKENYKWMIIGLVIIVVGFVLMYGKTEDIYSSSEALKNSSFSFSTHIKITLAPILILAGFVVEVFAIMKKPVAS